MFAFPLAAHVETVASSPIRDIFRVLGRPGIISFAGGIPDSALFAYDDLRACYDHVRDHHATRALQYSATEGEPEMRAQAARRIARFLPTGPEQVQITSGGMEGIYLAARTMLDPGDVVLVEDPTYVAAIQAFQMCDARIVSVASDDDGMRPDALADAIAEHRPALVYSIPSFQNPSGRTMPAQRRSDVAEVLLRTGTALLEDDPYQDLRYEGEPIAPIAAVPGMAEQTVLLGSVSKIVAPGVRIGWARGPQEILRHLAVAKQAVTVQTSVADQLAIARYLETCDLDAHLDRVTATYRERRDAMLDALTGVLPGGATVTRPGGGMFCWVDLHDDTDAGAMLAPAIEEGVAFVPGWAFQAGEPNRATMRLSFVTNDEERLREGVARLARTFGWG